MNKTKATIKKCRVCSRSIENIRTELPRSSTTILKWAGQSRKEQRLKQSREKRESLAESNQEKRQRVKLTIGNRFKQKREKRKPFKHAIAIAAQSKVNDDKTTAFERNIFES